MYGIILIFGEVKEGFRSALGGACEVFGINPDIFTNAKGLALSASIMRWGRAGSKLYPYAE